MRTAKDRRVQVKRPLVSPPPPPAPAKALTAHKFRVGQTVTLTPGRFTAGTSRGLFEVVKLLPVEHGVLQYRLKSLSTGPECVASESELS